MVLVGVFEKEADYPHRPLPSIPAKCAPADMIAGLWQKHFSADDLIRLDQSFDSAHFIVKVLDRRGAGWGHTEALHKLENNFLICKGDNGSADLAMIVTYVGKDRPKELPNQDVHQVSYAFTRWLAVVSFKASDADKDKIKTFVQDLQATLNAQPQPAQPALP